MVITITRERGTGNREQRTTNSFSPMNKAHLRFDDRPRVRKREEFGLVKQPVRWVSPIVINMSPLWGFTSIALFCSAFSVQQFSVIIPRTNCSWFPDESGQAVVCSFWFLTTNQEQGTEYNGTGNQEQGTRNREQGTGNREPPLNPSTMLRGVRRRF